MKKYRPLRNFFRKAAFTALAIRGLLITNFFIDPKDPSKVYSIIDKHKELKPIPDISISTLDFIHNLNRREHRRAMTSLIELFKTLKPIVTQVVSSQPNNNVPASTSSTNTPQNQDYNSGSLRSKALSFLEKYGYFIADLLDADSAHQVQNLLNDIADPPGSSRAKRRESFTANINGYVGGLVGGEMLSGNNLENKESFFTVAPSLPVGLSFSWLNRNKAKEKTTREDGKNLKHYQSLSLFFFSFRFGKFNDLSTRCWSRGGKPGYF